MPQDTAAFRRKSDVPPGLRLGIKAAPDQIVTRRTRRCGLQVQPKVLNRLLHHISQHRALVRFLLRARVGLRHWHSRLTR